MTTRDELANAMKALSETLSFDAKNGHTTLPDGAKRYTYSWRRDLADDRVRIQTVHIIEETDNTARFEGPNPTMADPEPRITEAQVLSKVSGAVEGTMNIRRDGSLEYVDVTVDSGSGPLEQRKYLVQFNSDDSIASVKQVQENTL